MGAAFAKFELNSENSVTLIMSGNWLINGDTPKIVDFISFLKKNSDRKILKFEVTDLNFKWDSSLLIFLIELIKESSLLGFSIEENSLPVGLRRLLNLYKSVPKTKIDPQFLKMSFFFHLLLSFKTINEEIVNFIKFLGELLISMFRFIFRRGHTRLIDCLVHFQQVGPEALPIVCLINFLVGLTVAFVGAIQLSQFGANIYVANLVALAMVREMGAMMTGVIMCGRTGAAFAAALGTMKVTEEIDALKVNNISPIDFLVLPRILSLTIVMPLLCIFADLVGIIGGMIVGLSLFDLSFSEYYNQTLSAITLTHFSTGIIKSVVFGVLVGLWGCFSGLKCENNASAVGSATTSAVVRGVTSLVIADALFAVLFNVLEV